MRRAALFLIVLSAGLWLTLTLFSNARSSASFRETSFDKSSELASAQGARDYSTFKHSVSAHSRLPCLLCHRRSDNSPVPVRSTGHSPCAGCHTKQFQDANSPLCGICHTQTGASNPQLKSFPALETFSVRFDHARHNRLTNCATCHKQTKGGTAFSIPAGEGAHKTCFECHAPGAKSNGRDISSCNVCHLPGRFVRASEWAKAFRVNFSHATHTRKRLSCNECHKIRAGMSRTGQVSSPVATEHFPPARGQSCRTCHDNERAFGGDDFSDCNKCHRGATFRF